MSNVLAFLQSTLDCPVVGGLGLFLHLPLVLDDLLAPATQLLAQYPRSVGCLRTIGWGRTFRVRASCRDTRAGR